MQEDTARPYLVVKSGKVANRVLWDGGVDTWQPPEGCEAVLDPGGVELIGGTYANGTFSPPEPAPPPVPEVVSPAQLRLALKRAGVFAAVDAFAKQAGDEVDTWWEYATEFRRAHPLLGAMAAQFGMTDQQVDAIFIQAARL